MAWLAVDKDGSEKISSSTLCRLSEVARCKNILNIFTKNGRKKWINIWSTFDDKVFSFDGIILPKGSIQKLIGRSLTWEDEPVELK